MDNIRQGWRISANFVKNCCCMCGNDTTLTNRKALYTVAICISQIDRITDRLSQLSSMKASGVRYSCERQAVMQRAPELRSSIRSTSIS